MDFKDNVKWRREREGYTTEELARKIGSTQSYISAIENGVRLSNHVVVMKLAEVFGCSADELLGLKEKCKE